MLRQNDAPPQLTGMEPVSLLIEMGIEKLKRDYLYIFSGVCFFVVARLYKRRIINIIFNITR